MKTINTSLPIYDRISKQCYEMAKKGHSGYDNPVPIICPRHKLPSFQWNAESDNMGVISKIEMVNGDYTGSETSMASGWTNITFGTLTTVGLNITSAISTGGGNAFVTSTSLTIKRGEEIRIQGILTLNSGTAPLVTLLGTTPRYTAINAGVVDIILVAEKDTTGVSLGILDDGNATNFAFANVTITKVDNAYGIHAFFQTLPAENIVGTDSYYSYNGDTLKYLMEPGTYYLKITMENDYILYSEWFKVTCVYDNLVTAWTNVDYNSLSTSGSLIINATESGASGHANSNTFSVIKGETINLIISAAELAGASQDPTIVLYSGSTIISNVATINLGTYPLITLNELQIIPTVPSDTAYLKITNTAASIFYASVEFIRDYSDKYLRIVFSNECDLGDILYSDGFEQTIWFESEPMEATFQHEEEGMNNGEGRFIRAFARQVKKYIARTKEMPAFMVDVFNRMKLHDNVELTDRVGDTNSIYNLEETHEWLGEDKYYTRFDLTFDYNEAYVVSGCCNNL
jgi:hypothetical protein